MPPEVHFDEAGNTGAALLDAAQPVFVLASNDFTREEADELLSIVRTPQTQEVKFSNLRRNPNGQRRLLQFLASPLLTPERAKVSVTHKKYMVIGKAIDIIEETLAHESGIDLYERGANIALANLHFYVTPAFCGQDRFDAFLSTFVAMVRTPTAASKAAFFASVYALYENCRSEQHKSSFGPYLYAEHCIDEILDGVTYIALDPAIGALFHQLSVWGSQLGTPFSAVHDASKPIAAERETFQALMDAHAQPEMVGYDRRKFEFPLRATTLTFGDSRDLPQLQVSDLLAGAMSHFAAATANGSQDEFTRQMEAAGVERFTIHTLWPQPEVTPQALGTEEVGGTNAVDTMMKALRQRRT